MVVSHDQPWLARMPAILPSDARRRTWLAFSVLLVAALVFLMWMGRGLNFYYDDWAWVQWRRSGYHAIFGSYNQHLVIAPVALFRILFATVGLGHYWVFRLFQALAHLACAAAVFEFARRRIGALALLLVLPFVVLGSGWDYVLLPVNFGFVASIALSVCALLANERDDRRGDVATCVLLVAATGCSEFAAIFSIGVAVESWRRDKSFRRVWVWAIPLALYIIWWLAFYNSVPGRQNNVPAVPGFAFNLAASAISGLVGLDVFWGPLLLAVAAVLVWRHGVRTGGPTPRLAGLLVTAAAFWLLVGLGRADSGAFTASRYVYTGAVVIILILAEALRGIRLDARGTMIAALVALVALAGNVNNLRNWSKAVRYATTQVSAELGALEIAHGLAWPAFRPDLRYAPAIFAGSYFAAVDAIGSSPADPPQRILEEPEFARLAADGVLLQLSDLRVVDGAGSTAPATMPPPLVEGTLAGSSLSRGPCVHLIPPGAGGAFDLRLPAGGGLVVKASGSAVSVMARRFAARFEAAPIATIPASHAGTLRSAADRSSLPWHVRLSTAQPIEACGTS